MRDSFAACVTECKLWLRSPPNLGPARKAKQQLLNDDRKLEAAFVEKVACCVFFLAARRASTLPEAGWSSVCRHCGAEEQDEQQAFWCCPRLAEHPEQAVEAVGPAQRQIPAAGLLALWLAAGRCCA